MLTSSEGQLNTNLIRRMPIAYLDPVTRCLERKAWEDTYIYELLAAICIGIGCLRCFLPPSLRY